MLSNGPGVARCGQGANTGQRAERRFGVGDRGVAERELGDSNRQALVERYLASAGRPWRARISPRPRSAVAVRGLSLPDVAEYTSTDRRSVASAAA